MTREEAIEVLNNTSFFAPSMSDVDEAIDMAIEALEHEFVLCKDCVNWQTDWDTSYDGYHYCSMVDIVIDGNFYCKDGERKILPKD